MTVNFQDQTIFRVCIQEMKKLPSNFFDIVIADPPYNIGKNFGNNFDNYSLHEYISWSKEWLKECQRLLKRTGTMFVYGFDEILAHISVLFPIRQQRWLYGIIQTKTSRLLIFGNAVMNPLFVTGNKLQFLTEIMSGNHILKGFLKVVPVELGPQLKVAFQMHTQNPLYTKLIS